MSDGSKSICGVDDYSNLVEELREFVRSRVDGYSKSEKAMILRRHSADVRKMYVEACRDGE